MFDKRFTFVTLFQKDDNGEITKDGKGNKVIRKILKIEEFTIYNHWQFSRLNKKLALLFPEENFTTEEEKEIFAAVEKVNEPIDFTGGKKGRKTSITEAITYLCETSNEKRFDILHNWTKAQVFFWVNESINFRKGQSPKSPGKVSREEFLEKIKEAEQNTAKSQAPEEKLRNFFKSKWGKDEEQMKRYTAKDLRNAYKRHLREGGERIEQ